LFACIKPLTIASYNDAQIKRIHSEITAIHSDKNIRYFTKAMFNEWQEEVKQDKINNYEEQWSLKYGIRKVRWRLPLGHAVAKLKKCQVSGWQSIFKKRYRKEKCGINNFDLLYLEPFENSMLLQDPDVALTMLISDIFITGPRLGFQLDGDTHLHKGKKDATEAQSLICDCLIVLCGIVVVYNLIAPCG
jgi:hypothetical protein